MVLLITTAVQLMTKMQCLEIMGRYLTRISPNALSKNILAVNCNFYSSNVIDPPDEPSFTIPRPITRDNEPLKQRKARLLYQSRKRGMLENDLLLSTFVAKYLEKFTDEQVEKYDLLINGPSNDWDIYYWATDIKTVPKEYDHDVMSLLRVHCKNLNKESRIRQPDLN